MNILLAKWYNLVYSYKRVLYDCCLDDQLRHKLMMSLNHYETKLLQVEDRM